MYYDYPFHTRVYNPHKNLKNEALNAVKPFVDYGLHEASYTSYSHALTEVAAIAYLLGKGYDPHTAYHTVESWEKNEKFY
jgi:hypothetical protein